MASEELVLAELIASIGKKLKRQLRRHCEMEDNDISLRDLDIIHFIAYDKKTMGEIATEIELTPGTITPIIDKLIASNILQRERDESIDRRKVFVSLGKFGKKFYDKHKHAELKVATLMMNSFSQEDKLETISVMKKIDNNLDNAKELSSNKNDSD